MASEAATIAQVVKAMAAREQAETVLHEAVRRAVFDHGVAERELERLGLNRGTLRRWLGK